MYIIVSTIAVMIVLFIITAINVLIIINIITMIIINNSINKIVDIVSFCQQPLECVDHYSHYHVGSLHGET
jgi:hypothetical protein